MDFVEIIKEFFNYILAQIDSWINILGSQFGIFGFVTYVWYLCIPNEITGLIILFVMMLVVIAFIRHVKG